MALTSFCGLLTLQVGAAILAAVFFALAGAILAANIFDYHSHGFWFPFSLILMTIFVIGLIIAGALMFFSSYSESRSLAIMSVVVIVILICYWLILCAFSFLSNPDHVMGVCIDTRCPETFWLGNLGYRRQHLRGEGNGDVADAGKDQPQPADGGKEKDPMDHRMEKEQVDSRMEKKPVDPRKEKEPVVSRREKRLEDGGKDKSSFGKGGGYVVREGSNQGRPPEQYHLYKSEVKGDQEYFKIKEHIVNFVSNQNKKNDSQIGSSDYLRQRVYPFAMKKEKWWQDTVFLENDEIETLTTTTQRGTPNNSTTEENKPSRYVFGFAMIGAIIIFIINVLFLLFSALVMYSWAQELSWADYYYYDDDPVVLVEDY